MLDKPIKAAVLLPKEYLTEAQQLTLDLWAHNAYHVNLDKDILGRVKTVISYLSISWTNETELVFRGCHTMSEPRTFIGECKLIANIDKNEAILYNGDKILLKYTLSFKEQLSL